jgi:hypothetical protein
MPVVLSSIVRTPVKISHLDFHLEIRYLQLETGHRDRSGGGTDDNSHD